MKYYRHIFIYLVFLNCVFLSYPQTIKEKIDSLLKDQFLQTSIIAANVYDLNSSSYLYRVNSRLLLRPASNMKLLTSIAALLYLGTEYQFITSLYYDGEIIGNKLFGNLYIEGGCDPEFQPIDLMKFVALLRDLNIKTIEGNLYADLSFKDSVYWGVGWMWDDDPSTDAPYLSALNINGNAVNVTLSPANVGQPADIILNPSSSFFTATNRTITVFNKEEQNFFITRNWFERKNEIVATGKVSLEKETNPLVNKSINVINPEYYFLALLKETLERNGISISGKTGIQNLPAFNKHLGSIPNSLMTALLNVNKNSNNLSAEMVLYALAEKHFGRPATAANGIKIINELIRSAGHDPEKYRIVDGSGVSHYNLISAELICDILKYIYFNEKSVFSNLYDTLPIAGIDGTLSKRMMNSSAFRNVRAKTGTLSGVSALSGYVKAANGNLIAFSMLIQNHVGQTSKAREIQDQVCRILADYK